MSPPIAIGASSIHIGFGWPVAVPLTLAFSSVAMRLGPVLAGRPGTLVCRRCGVFRCCCCVRGGVFRGIKSLSSIMHVYIVIARLAPIIGRLGGLMGWWFIQGFLVYFFYFFLSYSHWYIHTHIQYIHDIHFHFHCNTFFLRYPGAY